MYSLRRILFMLMRGSSPSTTRMADIEPEPTITPPNPVQQVPAPSPLPGVLNFFFRH